MAVKHIFARRRWVALVIFFSLCFRFSMWGSNVSLAWSPSTSPTTTGYNVYYGTASLTYGSSINAGLNTSATVSNLNAGQTYYFAVQAYDANQNTSALSAEITASLPPATNAPPAPPHISYLASSSKVNAGAWATMEVVASSTAPMTYQWFQNSVAVAGATNYVLFVTASDSTAGNYYVVVSNSGGSVTSSVVTLTVIDPPAITSQPGAQTVAAGANASFSIGLSGTQPVAYQWYFGGTPMASGTTAVLTIFSASAANAGSYSVKVTNAAGSVTSASATLSVTAPTPPVITYLSPSQMLNAGAMATMEVIASSSSPLTYQWFQNSAAVTGGTNYTLFLTASDATAGNYSVAVSNSGGSVTSSVVSLVVIDPPAITTPPTAQSVTVGGSAVFAVGATGSLLNYQWLRGGTALPGATASALALFNIADANAGAYCVVVSNTAGSVTSSIATLSVIDPPVITNQPSAQSANAGGSASFSVGAAGSVLAYQWFDGATPVAGAISNALTLTNVADANGGSYSVIVSNTAGSVTSSVVALSIIDPPAITSQPAAQTVAVGGSATFTVAATGTPPMTYQWRLGGNSVAGGTSAILNLAGVSAASAGSYSVVISNGAGSVTSAAATLAIGTPPVITYGTYNQTAIAGTVTDLETIATGTAPFTYQWFHAGTPVAGGTSYILWLLNVNDATAGNYTVAISNSAGSATSRTMTVTVVDPPAITSQPGAQTVTAGASVTLSVGVSGTSPKYQWFQGGLPLAGATTAILNLPSVSAANAGNYYVTASNAAGSVTTATAMLTVTNPVSFVSVAGTYNGLFYQTNGNTPNVVVSSAGLLGNFILGSNGVYSAQVSIAGGNYPLAGTLNASGYDSEIVSRATRGLSNLTVTVQMDLTGATQQMTGSVSNMDPANPWISPLLADLATNGLPVPAGNFMLYIPTPVGAPANSPSGYASVVLSASGSATMLGMLFDGTLISQSIPVAQDGTIPVYFSLYGGVGLIEGWVNLANDQPTGAVTWIRPNGVSTATPYPHGFTNIVTIN